MPAPLGPQGSFFLQIWLPFFGAKQSPVKTALESNRARMPV